MAQDRDEGTTHNSGRCSVSDQQRPQRPAIVIKTIEGRRSSERPVMPKARFDQLRQGLESKGIRRPGTSESR